MYRLPPRIHLTDTRCLYTTLFRPSIAKMGDVPNGQSRARGPTSCSSLIVNRAKRISTQRRHSHAPLCESQPPASGISAFSTEPEDIAPLARTLPVKVKSPSDRKSVV